MAVQLIERNETYSSPLVNYTELYNIFGENYTRFYTEINTELKVGDYVYILNGNYDNSNLIDQNEYQEGATGYEILLIDKNSIVLDIPYRSEKPFNEDDFQDYTKVYLVDSLSKFNYENIDNGFGFDLFTGEKYSTLNNNIFLSQIENMSYTTETQTKDKFFKSNTFDGTQINITELRGQSINDTTSLNWELEETNVYGLTPSGTGPSIISFGSGLNYVKDFDLISNSGLDKMVALTSVNSLSDSNIWTWDKKTREIFDVTIQNSLNNEQLDASYIKPFETGSDTLFPDKNIIRIKCPANLNGTFSFSGYTASTTDYTQNGVDLLEYDVEGFSETLILGYSGLTNSNNYRSFGLYNNGVPSYMVPSPDNMLGVTGSKQLTSPYAEIGTTYTSPFFVLSTRSLFSESMYFPVNTNADRFNIIPEYAEFSGIGNPGKVEINDWINDNDQSQNLEYCFLGHGNDAIISDEMGGGLYFYSYSGNHIDINTGDKYIGNAFELSKTTYDKYTTGIWSTTINNNLQYSQLNPFNGMSDPIGFLNSIQDIKWIGIEKKNPIWLDLSTINNGETVITNSSNGIYYSKYLVITSDNIPNYYIYLNFNSDLLRVHEKFEDITINNGIPQVHCFFEEIDNTQNITYGDLTTIGSNRIEKGDIYPYILDGEYIFGQSNVGTIHKYPINVPFNTFDFIDTSVTSVDYNDERWIVGAGSSDGVYVYDISIGVNIEHITTGTIFNIGDSLPSNNITKVRGEVIDGQRRIWVATDNGIFMFDSTQVINSDYYYTIDLDNNEIPLDTNLYKNGKLYIMEDFTYDGIDYKQGDICKWLVEDTKWVIDNTYLRPYLSKAHFEDGSFLSKSVLDDGIFGNRDSIANWFGNGAEWRNGILYNSNWLNGIMKSKSDEFISQSYYSLIKDNKINSITDFTNNNSFGYNMVIKSIIQEGIVNNGNFDQCVIGDSNITGLLDNTYSINNFTYADVTIYNGYFLHSDIYSTIVNNSKIESSNLNSSNITNRSRIISSNSFDSIIDDAMIENKGKIKIIGYDKWYNIKRDLDGIDVIHIHKFYIEEKDFNELKFGDSVIFNDVDTNTNNGGITDILDNIFYVLGGVSGYYADVYEDLNKTKSPTDIGNNSIEYATNNYKLFISKKLKTQNTVKSTISFNGIDDLIITGVNNNSPLYSIDLSIVVTNIPNNSPSEVYLNTIKDDSILKITANNITSATIQTTHIDHSWVNGGEWLNGSIISPNQISNKLDRGSMSIIDDNGIKMVKMYINDTDYEIKINNLYSIGDVVYISNLWDIAYSTYVGGNFMIFNIDTSGNQNYIILKPYDTITLPISTILSQPISQYKFINSNRIDGINNTLKIKKGLFKNQSFDNLEFNNSSNLSTYEDINTRVSIEVENENDNEELMIINSEISTLNNIEIKNGLFLHGQLTNIGINNQDPNPKGSLNSHKQVFIGFDINGGKINKSTFIDGEFNNGLFINNKFDNINDAIPVNNTIITSIKTAVLPVWISGNFNDGTFNKSTWMSGEFNNGKFLNSEFLGGVFNDGIFGDESSKSTLNAFRKGIFNNGTFNNGIFGDNLNRINETNIIHTNAKLLPTPYIYNKSGTNIWNDGNFNNGIFTTIDGNISIWLGGNFNNGQILDSVIWYDGVFNNGKFKSVYGRYVGNIVGEVNLHTISTDSDISVGASESGSRVVNLLTHYNNNLSFLNQYNIATIRNKHVKNKFNNPGTLILDTYDNQIKYTFVSDNFSSIISTFDDDNSAHGYGEYKTDIFYTTPFNLGLQFKSLEYMKDDLNKRNPLFESNVLGSKIFIQNTENEYIYDGSGYVDMSTFLGTSIPNTTLTYDTTYAWRGGVFNDGEFGGKDNYNNANPSWENGTFNGGKFYGKIWKNGRFIRGDFNGRGIQQPSEINIENIHRGYDPQGIVERYLTDFYNTPLNGSTYSSVQTDHQTSQNYWDWYGLWLNGEVLSNINEVDTINIRVSDNILVEYFKKDKFKRNKPTISNFNNMLWVDGIFDSNDANFNQSVWLSGEFNNGEFNNSMFNPYVQRWDFESGNLTNLKFTFELDTTLSIWNNGTFNSGVFYYSDWVNGTFDHGTMVGGKFTKGIANYISAFSTIWIGGRFRNGNWYGSNFTIENENNDDSVPNPFDYLNNYFSGVSYPPFITDILSNNANRLQDDRLHIWNIIDGTSIINDFDLSGHIFNTSSYSEQNGDSATQNKNNLDVGTNVKIVAPTPEPTPTEVQIITFTLSDESVAGQLSVGVFDIQLEVASAWIILNNKTSTPTVPSTDSLYYNFSLNIEDDIFLSNGIYTLQFYTILLFGGGNTYRWKKFRDLDYMTLLVSLDKYIDGVYDSTETNVKEISEDQIDDVQMTISAVDNIEYRVKLTLLGGVAKVGANNPSNKTISVPTPPNSDDFIDMFHIKVTSNINDVAYTVNNNTLNGYIEPVYDINYLDSDILTISGTLSYVGDINLSDTLDYHGLDIVTISVPTTFTTINGAFAQYGNGVFLEGIWENGVWNNGYRGTEFGTTIIDPLTLPTSGYTYDTFTYGSGASASVLTNTLYTLSTVYQWRTSPTIYFNKVQRSFKTFKNTWRFILESAFDVHADSVFKYNKLSIGDLVSVGNIIGIDINGNRKIIKDLFTVVDLPTGRSNTTGRKRITLEYKETFPIDDIQIDSDRHLIYVQKNVWLYGSFLNGYFEGIMNGGYIRGNREITKLIDSHLIDVKFEGGQLVGTKNTLSSAFDNNYNDAQSLSPQFATKYNDLYHTSVVQYMEFIDDMTPKTFDINAIPNVSIFGLNGEKEITYTSSGLTESSVQYLYNSDIDVVYEPEFFSSLYNQTIFNNHVVRDAKIGALTYKTKMHNIPAGYITYDILSSESKFKYSLASHVFREQSYHLNLGSKYKKYNTLTNVNLTTPTQKETLTISTEPVDSSTVDTIPNAFNIVKSESHDVYNRWFGTGGNNRLNDGMRFKEPISFDIHEDFMYVYGTSSDASGGTPSQLLNDSLIVANNDFQTRGRYHVVEVDVEFPNNKVILNPYSIESTTGNSDITFDISYTYSITQLPKLTIGQGYNEVYEYPGYGGGQRRGYLSPYDNDFIPYLDGRKLSEINGFTESNRITMKSFMYNNYGGYRDNVKIFEKGFDSEVGSATSSATRQVFSPIYYDIKHYEIDQIPFFRYQDFIDPLTGTVSEWNMLSDNNNANHTDSRKVDSRIKIPFYATSVPIRYNDDDFILSENINFFGGNGIDNNFVIDIDIYNIINS